MALLSFEQPFLSLVPFRESLVRTLSIGIFKRCILDSPVKTSSLLVVGAGCLQTCGETKIVERELVGQTTGDFFFFFPFGLLWFYYFARDWPKGLGSPMESSTTSSRGMPVARLEATSIFPASSVSFVSVPGNVFQLILILKWHLDFFPVQTDLLVTYTYLPVFNIQVCVFLFIVLFFIIFLTFFQKQYAARYISWREMDTYLHTKL